jgi:hypothetical protein
MTLKYPKGFNKMTLDEQETWLAKQLVKAADHYERIFRQLATVRGGMKVQAVIEDVPGLDYVKKE